MAALSISVAKGANALQPASYTIGVLAPGAGDFEFRWNQTDAGGLGAPANAITRNDAARVLRDFANQLESGVFTFTAGTPEVFP
jgi:hypothetical protein